MIPYLQFNELFNFIDCRGKSPRKADSGIPLLTAKNIRKGFISKDPEEFLSRDQYDDWILRGTPKEGDLLFTTEAPLGNVAILPKYDKVVVAQRVICLSPKKSIDSTFYKWLILGEAFQNELFKRSTGSTAKGIRSKELAKIKIPLPPLPIQRKIAEVLDAADRIRQRNKEVLAKYDQLAQSVFLEMFGDPVRNEKGWEVKKLSEVCSKITDGTHKTPSYQESGVVFLSAKNVKNYELNDYSPKYISQSEHDVLIKRCKVEKGDILITKSGSLGMAAINNFDFEFSIFESLALVKFLPEKVIGKFLVYFLNTPSTQYQYQNITKGVGVKHLHLTDLRKIETIIPHLTLQNQFASIIERIEQQKAQAQAELEQSEALFQSLMQRAFNGDMAFQELELNEQQENV